jgi:hypothetical protein
MCRLPVASQNASSDGCLRATDWSRDEQALVVFGGHPYQIAMLDRHSHQQTPIIVSAEFDALYGRLSPDNQWMSFTVRAQPARGRIVIAPTNGPHPVPEQQWHTIAEVEPDDFANWSPDGNTLYFTSQGRILLPLGTAPRPRHPTARGRRVRDSALSRTAII